MIPILYESSEREFTSNGLGRLRDCVRCEVTEERNGVYECEFDFPVDGNHFDLIIPGRIIAVEHDDKGDIQPFDIYAYSKPLNGVVTFHARHISYRLNYLTAVLSNISSLNDAFTSLGGSGTVYPDSGGFVYYSDKGSVVALPAADGIPHTVRQILGGIEGSILDTYGGEYEFNKFTVNLWNARGQDRSFTVRYGVNLTDYTEEMDYGESYNAVVPFWQKDDSKLVGGIVTAGLPSVYGRTECIPLDLSYNWENQPASVTALENAARNILSANQPNLPSQNIKVNFIRLADTEEYAQFAPLQTCGLCDRIKVVFPRYNIEGMYKIVKVVWDVLLDRYTEMELGNLSITLAEALGLTK